jgi:hypothetical protein
MSRFSKFLTLDLWLAKIVVYDDTGFIRLNELFGCRSAARGNAAIFMPAAMK